jgi:membrane protein
LFKLKQKLGKTLAPLGLDLRHMASAGDDVASAGDVWLGVFKRAGLRCWGRDVMLYVGGVSFFALLAVFPALALLIGFYGAVFTPEEARAQVHLFSDLLPPEARDLLEGQLRQLSSTSARAISAQSLLALIIGAYAAHRGFKALLAGLAFIYDEPAPHGFLKFNLLAFFVALGAFVLATVTSGVVIALRLVRTVAWIRNGHEHHWFTSSWLWSALCLVGGLAGLYRYAMSHSGKIYWPAAAAGGAVGGVLLLAVSWAAAFYVNQIVHLGATYGSIATVIVFLIWMSWSVNAVFFGGALATEVEILAHARRASEPVTLQPGVERLSRQGTPTSILPRSARANGRRSGREDGARRSGP